MEDHPTSPDLFLFLASTVHDMKNSISVLSGTLEGLLADASAKTESAYPEMAHMLYQTKRLNDNLIHLLALYKQVGTADYPADIALHEVGQLVDQVMGASRVLLDSKGITLEADFDTELIWHFDEDLIIGVIGNAINNAIRYTRDRIRLAIVENDGYLEIRVEDNGSGYPAPMLEAGASAMSGARGGVNFMTNSTGLGLHFSSEVVKMHKHRERRGTLHLENGGAYGGGCFVLRLP
jgi:two-component system, OmpR family, sensor histidine kinase SenX3